MGLLQMPKSFLSQPSAGPGGSFRSPTFWADLCVCGIIGVLGLFQLTHCLRTSDYIFDASYPDLARSLLEKGSYELRQIPQTLLPPGFPFLLALVGKTFGLSPEALLPVVVISATLGLLVAYTFLRRVE